jgi:hypothetical protein
MSHLCFSKLQSDPFPIFRDGMKWSCDSSSANQMSQFLFTVTNLLIKRASRFIRENLEVDFFKKNNLPILQRFFIGLLHWALENQHFPKYSFGESV